LRAFERAHAGPRRGLVVPFFFLGLEKERRGCQQVSSMSLHMNATLPAVAADGWLGAAQAFAQTSPTRALVLALVNIPVLAIVINVLLQLVRVA
jgi:hypothetical protein